jgi:chitodextrinase
MYSYPAPVDTEVPTSPPSLSGVSTSPSVNLSWTPSQDNYSVKEYEVYQGETLVGTTIWHKYFIDNLQPFTNYSFKVRAKDYNGNYSAFATTQVSTIGASAPIVNPGFEADGPTQTPSGWTESLTTTASYTEGGGRSGANKLVHYSATKFKVSTSQTLTGLANGTYTLSAYYMGGGGNVQMIGKDFGGTTKSISLGTATNVWTQKKLESIVVTNGRITIEFLSDFSTNRNGGWLFIDDVSLSQTSAPSTLAGIESSSRLSAVDEAGQQLQLTTSVYPNPVRDGWLTINLTETEANKRVGVSVSDLLGRIVYKDSFVSDGVSQRLNLGSVQPGVYVVRMIGANTYSSRIIVE